MLGQIGLFNLVMTTSLGQGEYFIRLKLKYLGLEGTYFSSKNNTNNLAITS